MTTPVILLVDDEPAIQRATATLLRSRGYAVSVAGTGAAAIAALERDGPRLVILDLGLPDMPGTEVCRTIRARTEIPIIVLSVLGDERSKVDALDAGADDYVTKPFSPEELVARVRAGLRRSSGGEDPRRGRVTHGDLVIDFDRRRVCRGTQELRLTPKEFDLLALLAAHHGRVLTHQTLLRRLWGAAAGGQVEHLRVLVGQLRKKIEHDPTRPRHVLTEPWVGYRFADSQS